MAIPMFLVLALPIGCFVTYLFYIDDNSYIEMGGLCIIPASIFSICCGCICNLIAIPIGLLVGPFFLGFIVIDTLYKKIVTKNTARERLRE